MTDQIEFKERELAPLNLDAPEITASWREGFEKQRTKNFNERRQEKADIANQAYSPKDIAQDPRERVLTDEKIEEERYKTMVMLIMTRVRDSFYGPGRLLNRQHKKFGVWHIWFPENDYAVSALRRGNPPADCDRPKHLKGKNLVIDLDPIPDDHWDWGIASEQVRRSMLSQARKSSHILRPSKTFRMPHQ